MSKKIHEMTEEELLNSISNRNERIKYFEWCKARCLKRMQGTAIAALIMFLCKSIHPLFFHLSVISTGAVFGEFCFFYKSYCNSLYMDKLFLGYENEALQKIEVKIQTQEE